MSDCTTNVKVQPAHETKHVPMLVYPFRDNIAFHLAQSDDGANNNTTLWPGAQILSAFLTDAIPPAVTRMPWTCVRAADADARALNLTARFGSSSSPSIPFPASSRARSPRAIELGSGVGLSSLVLAAQGWSVLATDTPAVVHSVLRPNIHRNTRNATRLLGTLQVRSLDWTVPPENWSWSNPECIAGTSNADAQLAVAKSDKNEELLGPPFDLILTADTVYSAELIAPLLRTLKHLILLSVDPTSSSRSGSGTGFSNSKRKQAPSPVYLALERRDPTLTDSFFSQARDVWGLNTQRIPTARVRRAISRAGLGHWKTEDWEGVEVWKLSLRDLMLNKCPINT